jgi:mRNA-degrading endonuclease RelE of RelBE toxin-antitoxin system
MPYDVFLPEFFIRIVKDLKKKYPHVGEDLKTALRVLVNNPELGRTLRGFGDVKKLRVQNSDVERGKSGGYRLIYLVDAAGQRIIPLILYSKSQKKDISKRELKTLLAGLAQDLHS